MDMKKASGWFGVFGLLVGLPLFCSAFSASLDANYNSVFTEAPLIGENAVHFRIKENVLDSSGNFTAAANTLADDMRCEIFRYPGGSVSDTYDWKRAVGASRIPQQMVWGDITQDCGSQWGPDEAGRFAESNQGTLVVCLTFNQGASNAADLVEYMNNPNDGSNPGGGTNWAAVRAANGHSAPYNVQYWEIGNESGGKDLPLWPNWPTVGDDSANDGISQSTTAAQNNWIYGGTRSFTNQQAVRYSGIWNDTVLQSSSNAAGETFYVKFPPAQSITEVRVGPTDTTTYLWTRVTKLANSSSTAKVYEFDEVTGRILFGDGVHGKKLPSGYKVYVTYASGPHDGYVDFYRAMTNVDPTIKIAASHLGLIKKYYTLPADVTVDGLQLHGGINYTVNSDKVPAGGNYHTELVGRGYFSYANMRSNSLAPMYNNNFPAGKKIYQTETALLDPCTFSGGVAYKYTICGALSHCLMFERAVKLFGDQSYYPMEMFMKTGFANQAETTRMINGVLVPTGIERAQELLIRRFGKLVLTETSRNIPSYNIPWFDVDGGTYTNAIPKIVPLVSKDSSGYVTVLGINTTTNETATLTVNVNNISGGASFTGSSMSRKSWTLRADSMSALNDDASQSRISISYNLNPSDITVVDADTLIVNVAPLTSRVIRISP